MPSLKRKSAQRQWQWQPKMRRTSLTTFCHVQQSAHELLKVLQHQRESGGSIPTLPSPYLPPSCTHSSLQVCISVCICETEAYVSGMWAWQQHCVCCLSFAVCCLASCCSPHSNCAPPLCPSPPSAFPFHFSLCSPPFPVPLLAHADNIKWYATHPA